MGKFGDGERGCVVDSIAQAKGTGFLPLCSDALRPRRVRFQFICDCKELERLGLPVLLDQPAVGQNLQDHLEFYVQYLRHG